MTWRHGEAAERFAERRRREDEAPRLHEVAPDLVGLKLEISEMRDGSRVSEAGHVKRIVVASAPALFVLPCGDASCRDGAHDLTYAILRALRQQETHFDGEDACMGQIRSAQCQRVLRFVATAEYKA